MEVIDKSFEQGMEDDDEGWPSESEDEYESSESDTGPDTTESPPHEDEGGRIEAYPCLFWFDSCCEKLDQYRWPSHVSVHLER